MKILNFRNKFRRNISAKAFTFACLSGLTALGFTACSDNELDQATNKEDGALVTFKVSMADKEAQDAAKANPAYAATRAGFAEQLRMQGLSPEDLTIQKHEIPGHSDMCLIESTVAGIDNDILENSGTAATRAEITTLSSLGNFSVTAYRGTAANAISTTPWFYNNKTNKSGNLEEAKRWAFTEPYARFFAVYPYDAIPSKLTLSPKSNTSTPYVTIDVKENVSQQIDLMTACSGETPIHYATQGTAPTVPLKFQHAMTAIRFKVGSNLSPDHKITKIVITKAMSQGKFTLPSSVLSTTGVDLDNAWSEVTSPKNFTLSDIEAPTKGNVNALIVGRDGKNETFYMIPQELTGKGMYIHVYFDGEATPAIKIPLKGTWKAGTTKTYALSQSANSYKYVFSVEAPKDSAAYDATLSSQFKVISYYQDGKVQKKVKWNVVGYDENLDGTYSMNEKPSWLTSLDGGEGSADATGETRQAVITKNIRDLLSERNAELQKAPAVTNYNLANSTGAALVQNTANSYVISAPGTYRIPLVYGNAVKEGRENSSAYTSTASPEYLPPYTENLVLEHFVDHKDNQITTPYINRQNASDPATKGKLVWTDAPGAISGTPNVVRVSGGFGTDDYLEFTVKKENLINGNAVVAVTNETGVVLWSWHLWFAPKSVLSTINHTSRDKEYKFTSETLGWRYTKWMGATAERKVSVKLEQEGPDGKKETATVLLVQHAGIADQEGNATMYQWGRKDALPGVDGISGYSADNFTKLPDQGENQEPYRSRMLTRTIGRGIQFPGTFLPEVGAGKLGWQYKQYINLWSVNNNDRNGKTRDVVKTIYDPSPVGFQIPDPYAFDNFNTTNASWNKGFTFKLSSNEKIFFPAGGARDMSQNGKLVAVGTGAYFWTANTRLVNNQLGYAWRIKMSTGGVSAPTNDGDARNAYSYGFSVRPVRTN